MSNNLNLMDKCICCQKNEVTYPLVCDECQDKEAQEELHNQLIDEGLRGLVPDPQDEHAEWYWSGGECKTCGMLYDGGQRCTYCGDSDPWNQSEYENEEF